MTTCRIRHSVKMFCTLLTRCFGLSLTPPSIRTFTTSTLPFFAAKCIGEAPSWNIIKWKKMNATNHTRIKCIVNIHAVKSGMNSLKLPFYYDAIFVNIFSSLSNYYIDLGWMSCLILFVLAALSAKMRLGNDKNEIKKFCPEWDSKLQPCYS